VPKRGDQGEKMKRLKWILMCGAVLVAVPPSRKTTGLLAEKERLETEKAQVNQKSRAARAPSVKALNKKIQALNAKIEDFEKRAQARRGAHP
jgi:hypothetical protein